VRLISTQASEAHKAALKKWGSNAEAIVPVSAKQAISKKQAGGAPALPKNGYH